MANIDCYTSMQKTCMQLVKIVSHDIAQCALLPGQH